MYAVIADSGKQYRVEEGQLLEIDYRADLQDGAELSFDRVLCVGGGDGTKVGQPLVDGASVSATVVTQLSKGEKIYIQYFRRRKNVRRRTGHRQKYTQVKIGKIVG